MAVNTCKSVGFFLAENLYSYDIILHFCIARQMNFHVDLPQKKIYLFHISDAIAISSLIMKGGLKSIFINII